MKRKTENYTKKWKSELNPISAWSFLLAFEIAGIYRRNAEVRGV